MKITNKKEQQLVAYEELQTKLKIKKAAKIFTHIMKMVKETYR